MQLAELIHIDSAELPQTRVHYFERRRFSGLFQSQDTGEVGLLNGGQEKKDHDHVQPHVAEAYTRQASMRPPSMARRMRV